MPRKRIFAALAVSCLALAIGYGAFAAARAGSGPAGTAAVPRADQADLDAVRRDSYLVFRAMTPGPGYGTISLTELDDAPARARAGALATGLACERFHFAGDRGVCLALERGILLRYTGIVVDAEFRPIATFPLAGIPSRARVSPDGRLAATTVFVNGHSYAGGSFSTQTTIVDTGTGDVVADLEDFEAVRDGELITSPDVNYWGVTFTSDSERFYATLGTEGETYLVEGDLAARRVTVLDDNVECPSLSPDGTMIAFKKRVAGGGSPAAGDGPISWQFHVLDLGDMSERPLAGETRSVDDQIEWLDDERVVYGVAHDEGEGSDLWVAPVDGGAAELFLADAESPAAVRP